MGVNPVLKTGTELEKLFEEDALKSMIDLIIGCIKHVRNKGQTAKILDSNNSRIDHTAKEFFDLTVEILRKYEDYLFENNLLDFEGLLIDASKIIESGHYQSPFKMVLVDEFQDISHSRLRLLLNLKRQNPDLILFAVGDDWQGIYKFAGADLDIFVNFNKYFGKTKEMYLTKTFRCSQGIATIAADFVQKNKVQKKKVTVADYARTSNTIEIVPYRSRHDVDQVVEDLIRRIVDHHRKSRIKIFVLGRYNRSKPYCLEKLSKALADSADIEYMTFHKSKGLEAKYCILIGLNSGSLGFPSIKEDHPFLQMFVRNEDLFPFAEERRLFYVALTRAQEKAFLLSDESKISSFVKELKNLDMGKGIV